METRYKLRDKQYEALREANRRVALSKLAYEADVRQLDIVSGLILDSYGIVETANIRIESTTQELVVTVPDVPAA